MMNHLLVLFVIFFSSLNLFGESLVFKDTDGITENNLGIYKDIDITAESFEFYMPKAAKDVAGDVFSISENWQKFCEKHNVAMLAAQKVGNHQSIYRRVGVSILGLDKVLSDYKIDRDRLYIMGYSGGGRVASMACYFHPDIFKGCLGICGINFHEKVDLTMIEEADEYGYFKYTGKRVDDVKKNVKFAVVTGENDFRYHYLKQVVSAGYQKHDFEVKIFDLPGYGHQLCSDKELELVYEYFIEGAKLVGENE